MKSRIPNVRSYLEIFSLIGCAPVMTGAVLSAAPFSDALAATAYTACTFGILLPSSREGLLSGAKWMSALFAILLLLCLYSASCQAVLYADTAYLLLRLASRRISKYGNVRMLFRNVEIWNSIEDDASSCYQMALYALCVAALALKGSVWNYVPAGLMAVEYALLVVRSVCCTTCFLGRGRETAIKEIMKGNLRAVIVENEDNDNRMNEIWNRVLSVMELKKPYLRENFSVQELAEAVYTNKVYLSRVINRFSGKNFNQFVNYYRVNYAVDLIAKDKRLKVAELAMMSGFSTYVTFNMAFKMHKGISPSAYIQEQRKST